MTDDILDSIGFIIGIMITGVVLVVLGITLQSGLIVLVGGILVGAVPVLKLIMVILERR
jgi:hypothetical protein